MREQVWKIGASFRGCRAVALGMAAVLMCGFCFGCGSGMGKQAGGEYAGEGKAEDTEGIGRIAKTEMEGERGGEDGKVYDEDGKDGTEHAGGTVEGGRGESRREAGEDGTDAQINKEGEMREDEWKWKDKKVKEAVYAALGCGDGEVPGNGEIEALECLRIPNAQEVKTFRDLEHLTGLEDLSLFYSSNSNKKAPAIDLDFAMVPGLKVLEISGCNLEGNELLTRLSGFLQLTRLYLINCGIENISFLEELPQLTHISFYGNEITDITPLASCRDLVEISLACNHISDISVIKQLEKLEEAGLHGNEISSIEPLRGLRNLKGVNITSNQIADLSPLEDCYRLEALGAGDNRITDITPLKKLTRLYNLALDYNQIGDISALEQMADMNWLGLSNNRITDFMPIEGMKDLFYLSIFNNPGRNIGELAFSVPELYLGTSETEICPAEKKAELEKAQQWLDKLYPGEGIVAEDVAFGDLDGDGREDMAVTGTVEAGAEEKETMDFGDTFRRIYVLLRDGKDSFLPVEPVETLPSWGGGVYGDPYQGICISDGKLVAETYGGSNWRWGYRNVYTYENENGQMEETMEISLEHFVYTDGYDWSVKDYETGNRRDYVITGGQEGVMKKLLIAGVDEAQRDGLMKAQDKVLGKMAGEKGVDLPPVWFGACLPEIAAEGAPYAYTAHDSLCNTKEKTASVLEKAAGEFLTDAAAVPVMAYTSEEIKGNYDTLTGVEVPGDFYFGWADGKPVRLFYRNLLWQENGAFVHVLSWEEPGEDAQEWSEKAVVYYREDTGMFEKAER